jgi:branched-chain amino acid transport system permease protein
MASPDPRAAIATRHRFRPIEALPWLLAIAAFVLLPDYAYLGTQVMILVLFALSLDLILGYAGIVTLGHAAYFGLGAYTAGMLSAHLGWHEPLTGLLAATAMAALFGFLSGLILMRYHGLALLMLTLAVGSMLLETANATAWLTGGFDGLYGITPAPIFGIFENDLYGHTYYWYALAILFLAFLLCRRIVHSPFGLSLKGLRENERRMRAIGCDVLARKVAIFTVATGLAGLAGGLYAQANAFVSLDVFSFARSPERRVWRQQGLRAGLQPIAAARAGRQGRAGASCAAGCDGHRVLGTRRPSRGAPAGADRDACRRPGGCRLA